jgi:hypothetical protein
LESPFSIAVKPGLNEIDGVLVDCIDASSAQAQDQQIRLPVVGRIVVRSARDKSDQVVRDVEYTAASESLAAAIAPDSRVLHIDGPKVGRSFHPSASSRSAFPPSRSSAEVEITRQFTERVNELVEWSRLSQESFLPYSEPFSRAEEMEKLCQLARENPTQVSAYNNYSRNNRADHFDYPTVNSVI